MNPVFLWGRRWRSLGDTIRVKSVPKWAGGRYAIPPASFPFLRSSFLHPPLPEFFSHPSFRLYPRFSLLLFPTRSSLLPAFACERDPMALATLSLGSLGSFFGLPVPGISEFPGILGFDWLFALHCIVLHCVTLRRTCMCIASCFRLPWFTLLYFALNCTSSHCLTLASLTSACNTSRSIVLASGFHGNVLHCTAIASIAFFSPLCISSH